MSFTLPHDPELFDLITNACEGELDEAARARLDSTLQSDPRALRIYLQSMFAQALLERFDAARPSDAFSPLLWREVSPGGEPSVAVTQLPWTASLIGCLSNHARLSIVAGTVLAISFVLVAVHFLVGDIFPFGQANRSIPLVATSSFVARYTNQSGAVWLPVHPAPLAGERLDIGQMMYLDSGIVEISLSSGVRLWMQGPSTFSIQSNQNAFLAQGRLTAVVDHGVENFAVETRLARVVNLGTEFGVAVNERQRDVQVKVYQGKVRIQPAAQSAEFQILDAGHACRVTSANLSASPQFARMDFDADFQAPADLLWPQSKPMRKVEVVADYRRDWEAFRNLPSLQEMQKRVYPDGWQFYWNARGPLGDPRNYEPLAWIRGVGHRPKTNRPPSNPFGLQEGLMRYARLHIEGGYPAAGTAQAGKDSATCDRAVIACYQVDRAGNYAIDGSSITCVGQRDSLKRFSAKLQVAIFVNEESKPRKMRLVSPNDGAASFNVPLGPLKAGSRIWVAVGPHGSDEKDAFEWNFQVVREIEEATTGEENNAAHRAI